MTGTVTTSEVMTAPWSDETTTSTGEPRPQHFASNRTVEPAKRDRMQLSAVRLAGDRRYLAWIRPPELRPNDQSVLRYVLAIDMGEDIVGVAGDAVQMVSRSTAAATSQYHVVAAPHHGETGPRTPLGRRLRELRRRIVASGAPLLDWDGLDQEIRARRGERTARE